MVCAWIICILWFICNKRQFIFILQQFNWLNYYRSFFFFLFLSFSITLLSIFSIANQYSLFFWNIKKISKIHISFLSNCVELCLSGFSGYCFQFVVFLIYCLFYSIEKSSFKQSKYILEFIWIENQWTTNGNGKLGFLVWSIASIELYGHCLFQLSRFPNFWYALTWK